MGFRSWWKRSSSRSLNQPTTPSTATMSPQSLHLSTSKSVQTLRSTAASTTSSPAYTASCYCAARPSTSTPGLQRHSSLRSFSLTSRSSHYHAQLQTTSPVISQDPPTHVDLLDAQGQFRPSDFHARLKASGTRNYGEDVAERNLGQNGVELSSPAVKAFYANLPKDALRSRKFNYPISILEDPEEPSVPVSRTRSLCSSTQYRRRESTRPASRNSVCSTPGHKNATTQNFRNSSLSIGRPTTLQANSRLSINTRERSASPPAISRNRSNTPASTITGGGVNQPAPLTQIQPSEELGIHDISFWHPVPSDPAQRRASSTPSPTNSSNYETADSTLADGVDFVSIPDTPYTLETLAELSDYTTEGEDVDAYLQKCKRRTTPDDEALIFKEDGFGVEGHGVLPGLFDDLPEPEDPETIPEFDEEPSSVEESIPTPTLLPSLFNSQRERLLALGFDYDSEEEQVQEEKHNMCTPKTIYEAPCTVAADMGPVKTALERRKQHKRQQLRTLKHNRRVRKRWGIEDDGNEADVE